MAEAFWKYSQIECQDVLPSFLGRPGMPFAFIQDGDNAQCKWYVVDNYTR
jgi:hypothetical protein